MSNLIYSQISEFWNQRYQSETYVYGKEPNDFFASQIADIKPGNIIFPCEGEGRNAVYAATLGWNVQAFDGSLEGQKKAFQLASKKKYPLTIWLLMLVLLYILKRVLIW